MYNYVTNMVDSAMAYGGYNMPALSPSVACSVLLE